MPVQRKPEPGTPPSAEFFAHAYTMGLGQTMKFLKAMGAQHEVAEETAQAAWVRGWEARDQLQFPDRIVTWINTIAFRRLCSDHRRSVRHSVLDELPDERSRDPAASVDAEMLLNRCSPFEKTLLTERYLDGMDMRAIAASRGLSEIAVRLRIHRCQNVLRSIVSRTAHQNEPAAVVAVSPR